MPLRPSLAAIALAALSAACSNPDAPISYPQGVALIDIVPLNAGAGSFGGGPHFVATAKDAKGQVIDGQTFDWLSSSPSVATLQLGSGGPQSADATAMVLANGVTTVSASVGPVVGKATLTVLQIVARIGVTPRGPLIGYAGQTFQLATTVQDANGFSVAGRSPSWQSSNAVVADVTAAGLVTAKVAGTATLNASADTARVAVSFNVRSGPIYLSRISTGDSYTCGIGTDNHNFCWGTNASGQLGTGSTGAALVSPAEVSGTVIFDQLSAGSAHVCATSADFGLCWGSNQHGALGVASRGDDRNSPALVATNLRFDVISAGDEFTCAIARGNVGYCWGDNQFGQVGSDTIAAAGSDTPKPLTLSGTALVSVSAGSGHACAISDTGVPYCWGRNTSGEVGDGTTTSRAHPVPVSNGLILAQVSAGGRHSCGITAPGLAYCWGANDQGQLGDGTTSPSATPVAVGGGLLFASISAGTAHTCGVSRSGGATYCWGANDSGQLGDGTTVAKSSPTPILGTLALSAVSAGGKHSCGFTTAGSAYCWGRNTEGQGGDATSTNRLAPTLVFGSRIN